MTHLSHVIDVQFFFSLYFLGNMLEGLRGFNEMNGYCLTRRLGEQIGLCHIFMRTTG